MSEEVCCLFSLCERRYVKKQKRGWKWTCSFYIFFALTLTLSCVCLRSGALTSPSVSGRTGTWSCNLQDASQGRNHRSQLEERSEKRSMLNTFRNIQSRYKFKVMSAQFLSTAVVLPVETGRTRRDYLCSFMPHCTPSDDPDAARRSWPGSPSLIHQLLPMRTCLSSITVLSAMLAVALHVCCVSLCLHPPVCVCVCVCVGDDKMPDNHFKDCEF